MSSATNCPDRSPESRLSFTLPEPIEAFRAIDTQTFESLDAPLVASASCLDTLANPDFFLCPEFLEAPPRHILRGDFLLLALFIGREVARDKSAGFPDRAPQCES